MRSLRVLGGDVLRARVEPKTTRSTQPSSPPAAGISSAPLHRDPNRNHEQAAWATHRGAKRRSVALGQGVMGLSILLASLTGQRSAPDPVHRLDDVPWTQLKESRAVVGEVVDTPRPSFSQRRPPTCRPRPCRTGSRRHRWGGERGFFPIRAISWQKRDFQLCCGVAKSSKLGASAHPSAPSSQSGHTQDQEYALLLVLASCLNSSHCFQLAARTPHRAVQSETASTRHCFRAQRSPSPRWRHHARQRRAPHPSECGHG